jgi:hypothetical protein
MLSQPVSHALIDLNIISLLLEHFHKYVPLLPDTERAQSKGNILRCISVLFDTANNKEKLSSELVPSLKAIAENEQEVQYVRTLAQSLLKESQKFVKTTSSSNETKSSSNDAGVSSRYRNTQPPKK